MHRAAAFMAATALVAALAACKPDSEPRIVIADEPGLPVAGKHSRARDAAAHTAQAAAAQMPSGPFIHVSGPGYEGYVRPARGPGHWEPGAGDIAAMEARVPAALAAAIARDQVPAMDLATYTRQYFGYIKDSKKTIETRFYCPSASKLAAADVHISGGGDCIVKTIYDPGSGQFRHWRTAGEP